MLNFLNSKIETVLDLLTVIGAYDHHYKLLGFFSRPIIRCANAVVYVLMLSECSELFMCWL
jgi:hypothetical protein